jgi:DNA-binding NarL/FixJ family response regulator
VKAYVSAILLRLAVKNRVQAAIVAYEAGLVTS